MAAPALYHCPQTRSGTTLWMNEELGGPCEIRLVNLQKGEQKSAEYLAVNPMGKVPALVDDGVVVTEAAAICAHLADRYADRGLAPKQGDAQRGAYYRWMFYAPSCIEPLMLDKLSKTARANPGAVGYGDEASVLGTLRAALEGREFILGDRVSAADVVLGSTLNFAMMFGAIEKTELFRSYTERLMSRPAAKAANERNAGFMAQMEA